MTQYKTVHIQSLMSESGVSFGTSGVRGLVSAMTDALCFAYTLAFAQALNLEKGSVVAIATDLRSSSPNIAAACNAALAHLGIEVDFCGAIPTPALAYYAEQKQMAGIMITGSHIPFDRNGIKFYSALGEITKTHEASISSAIVNMPDIAHTKIIEQTNVAAKEMYLARYTQFFAPNFLQGFKLAFYEHSSVARDLLTEMLQEMGAHVISLGRTNEFVPIDTEAVAKSDVERAKDWACGYTFDAIISTDGDADRPLIGDETGQWLRGDIVGLLTAQFIKANAVATPVSCNTAIELSQYFSEVKRTKIGSPFVIEAMQAMIQQNIPSVVGFEANGGFLLGSTVTNENGSLAQLCTRDAVLPILAVIALAQQKKCKVSDLIKDLPARATASDRIQNFATQTSRILLTQLADNPKDIESLLGDLAGQFLAIDLTDGLRITFKNSEIVHFRPSGNAPELRCYAEATTQTRADFLVLSALSLIQSYALKINQSV